MAVRPSIRDQILLPLIAIQAVAIGAITLVASELAARRSEGQVIDRLNGVVGALGHARFPYTASVLARMRGLSGAEFVAYEADGRVGATSFSGLRDKPPNVASIHGSARIDSLGESPTVMLDGVRYFAVAVRSDAAPQAPTLLVLYPETSWRQARREAATPPLWLGGGTLLLMVAVTSWIAHRIARRVRAVQRQVARIASGDLEGPEPGPGGDEIDELARSIHLMRCRLKEMSQTIQRSERERVLAQFAAGMAHQMRNSLTGARMSIQLHARRSADPSRDRGLEVALRQLAITEEQVKGLLSLGRHESRPREGCDLTGLLREVALLVGPACEHAKVTLVVSDTGPPVDVMADVSGVRAAVLNLCLNAIDAAAQGGTVRLDAVSGTDGAAVEVRDTGPGPPPDLNSAIFEPFVTSKPEGVGLGLALARQVAAQHGGTLSWSREGQETRFRLTVPRQDGVSKGDAWARS
jgi:signal transduction histidine kinase